MITDAIRQKIAAASVYSTGEGIPWRTLLQKEKLKIGFMGGSVTQGYADCAVHFESAYPAKMIEALRAQGRDAEGIVCAEPGMFSMQGNLLADDFILNHRPDLVFLEFAINETTLKPSVMSFESLLRKILTQPEPPVVCLFLLRNARDYSCESFMIPLAEHYHLPCVRLRQGMNPALERGELEWEDYGDSESHPSPEGHLLLAECLLHLLKTAEAQPETPPQPLPEPWLDAPFTALRYLRPAEGCAFAETNAAVVPRYSLYYPQAWQLTPETGAMRLSLRCRALVIFYETHRLPEYGECRVTVDGEPMNPPVLQGYSIYGWGNARYAVALEAEESAEHSIVLEPENGSFFVLGFGIAE